MDDAHDATKRELRDFILVSILPKKKVSNLTTNSQKGSYVRAKVPISYATSIPIEASATTYEISLILEGIVINIHSLANRLTNAC